MSNLEKKITVVHIVGTGRNGSTLLERVLNEIPDFFAIGEFGWTNLEKMENFTCRCGKKFQVCPTWSVILKEDDFQKIDKKRLTEGKNKYNNTRSILKFSLKKEQDVSDTFKEYLHNIYLFYRAVQKNRACQFMTDSTGSVAHCYNLSLIPEIDLYVIHIVRDSRGVAHSRGVTKCLPNSNVVWLAGVSSWRTAVSWLKRNLFIEFAFSKRKGKYIRVHYEDFIENPTKTVKKIGNLLGLELKQLDFIDDKSVVLGETHLIGGNVYVSKKGRTVLKLDERWKRDMKWWKIVLVTLITWPLLLKYFVVDKMMKKI